LYTLKPVVKGTDIPKELQKTPVGLLLEYHNLRRSFDKFDQAKLLIGMCMDNRKHLRIPDNFAFIIRAGGANLRYSEFKVSFAIAMAGVRHIALIGHNHCGMSGVLSKKKQFITGLVKNAGWSKEQAEHHFDNHAVFFEIEDEPHFIWSEAKRLSTLYPKVMVVPMIYKIEDNNLYLIQKKK
jgi:carbonic anhydrase